MGCGVVEWLVVWQCQQKSVKKLTKHLTDCDDCGQDVHEGKELDPGDEDVREVGERQREEDGHDGRDRQKQWPEKNVQKIIN